MLKYTKIYNMILLTLIISIFSCNEVSDSSKSCYSNYNSITLLHDNIEREYILYVPASYNESSITPLMFNFHGFGGSASEYIEYADMRPISDEENFILVYPQGSCMEGSSHWNPCPVGGDNKSNADDVGFVEAIINDITNQYNIDIDRIYATGYSNGGMMAYGLANYKSELFAAVSSVSGSMLDCLETPSHPIAVLHLHGTSDEVIPYDGNNLYSSVQNTINHWINFNNTNTNPITEYDETNEVTVEHYKFNQGDNYVSVEHYKYIGGNHVWFEETFQGRNTAELIWDFVSRYDINGLL